MLITLFRHPEFTTIPFTGAVAGLKPGTVVDNDGSIQFPLVGTINVGGHTLPEIREMIEKAVSKYIPEPNATVQVLVPGSLRYNMIGQFVQPGVKISDRPLTLLEGIAMAGSIDLARSNLRGAYIVRGGRKLPIDFHRLLRGGDLRQNIRLQNNDVILVPDNVNEVVYVFGSGLAKGAAVPILNGRMTLLQALAAAGFGYTDHSQGRFSRVRVLRSSADHAQFFVVDAEKMLRGEAAPFMVEAGDLVFVPETAWTKWNQILAQVLPSLQLIAGLLEPFVRSSSSAGSDASAQRALVFVAGAGLSRVMELHRLLDWEYSDEGLRALIEGGADVNERRGGETPLHVAAMRRRVGAIEMLLAHGADADARNDGGKTAYVHALRRGFDDVVEVLEGRSAVELTEADRLAVALVGGRLDEARAILATHPGAARTGNPEEDRLLADLAGRPGAERVKLLVDAGADLAATAMDGGRRCIRRRGLGSRRMRGC